MESKSILGMILAVTVSIMVAGLVLAPVVSSTVEEISTVTYTNTGDVYFSEIDISDGAEITATSSGFSIDGETYVNTTNSVKYIYSDEFKVAAGSTVTVMNAVLFTNGVYGSYISGISIADGVATFTYTSSSNLSGTVTCDCTWLCVSDDNGDLVYCEDGAYINDDNYYATYPIGHTSAITVEFVATIEDRAVSSVNGATISGTTVTDVSDDVTASLTVTDNFATVTATYDDTDYALGILAPVSVDIVEESTASGDLIGIIPIIVILAILMIPIRYVTTRD